MFRLLNLVVLLLNPSFSRYGSKIVTYEEGMEDFGCSPSTLSHAFPRFKLPTKVPPFLLEGFAIVCGTRAPKGARFVPVRSLHDDDDNDDDESEASSAGRVYQNITWGRETRNQLLFEPKVSKVFQGGTFRVRAGDYGRASSVEEDATFHRLERTQEKLAKSFPAGNSTPCTKLRPGQAPDRRKVNRRVSKCWVRFPQI